MLAYVEFPYAWATPYFKLPRPEWDALVIKLSNLLPEFASGLKDVKDKEEPDAQGNLRYTHVGSNALIDLATDGPILLDMGLIFTVKRFKGAYIVPTKTVDGSGNQTTYNVQVAIPDLALLNIKTVAVEEDCCTDTLQIYLDRGWRILAICPPHAQRRPDYILGHTEVNPK